MKKEESNIGQLSLFDVIDGGKHGEAENVNLIKIKHKIMVDAAEFESIDEIFSGYSKLQVITFSYNWDFINKLLKYFEYVEIILGATCIVDKDSKMPYIFANATQIQKAACKYKRVSDMIQSGKLSVGKTFMMSVILKLMTGKNIPEEKGVEVGKDKLKALQTGSKGIPIFVDEISSGYISQKGDYLKNPEQCERLSLHCMPLVVFASNEILSLEEKYRKRIMLISYEGCLPSTVDQSEYKSKGKAILNRLTNAFYREYLRRMLPQINDVVRHMYDIEHREDGYYPDIMSISSNVIIDMLNEYGYDIPEYIRPLTWNHDYSINATSVSSDALEQIEGLYKTNKKDFIIDTVADTVTLVLGKTGEIEKMFLAWERCLPNEICAESTPSRDVCRIKFNKTQLETFLGHTLSNGFMSFIQSKRRR